MAVYFVIASECKVRALKIGYSRDDIIWKRFANLQSSCPIQLSMWHIWYEATTIHESWLHTLHREHHRRGDWFDLTDALASDIASFILVPDELKESYLSKLIQEHRAEEEDEERHKNMSHSERKKLFKKFRQIAESLKPS